MSRRIPWVALPIALAGALLAVTDGPAAVTGNPRAESVLARLPFSEAERAKILAGELVTTSSRESTSNRELAITMAFLIHDPPPDLVSKSQPAQAAESFFWVNFDIDGRPTLALTHRLVTQQADGTYVVADRHYYVSRSHNAVQVVAGIFPVAEGALVLYSN